MTDDVKSQNDNIGRRPKDTITTDIQDVSSSTSVESFA